MNMQLDPWLSLADAAGALLARLRDMTTEEFAQGGEKAEREALDAALVAAWQELYRVTSFAFDPDAQTVALAERAGNALEAAGIDPGAAVTTRNSAPEVNP